MNLSELIFKRLSADENLQTMLATYAGAPAIFDSEFPADQQEGWEGATQYPRICYRIDMQVNQERSSAGTLYVAMYTDKTSTIIEDIETAVKHCLQDVLMKPAGEAPFCVAWARTESYAIEGKEVWCKEMAFDILEYSEQFSTDPDPVLAVAAYIKKIFPETIVLGIDNVGDFVETSKTPVFYCRLAHLAHTTGHCMNTISWFIGKIAVHLIYPGAGTRLKTLASINQKVAIDEEIIMLDDSPMTIQGLELNNKSDYLREGQLTITGKYGCLRCSVKKHNIARIGNGIHKLKGEAMAETKKTNAPEETKEVLPAEKETEYGVDELIAARDQLFSCPDCAMVALKLSKKKSMTVSEAEKLVEEFMKKEVK